MQDIAPLAAAYDPLLVALSIAVAILASYTALDLAGRFGAASGLAGTLTFEVRAPRTLRLENLSRVILLVYQGKDLTGRLPLEFSEGKAGEVLCHFQLTPEAAKGSVLELVCPAPDEPSGVVYEIDLSAYLTAEGR